MKLINKLIKNLKTLKIYKTILIYLMILLVIYFAYLLRLPIVLGGLSLYTKLHNNPYMEQLIGEFYLSLAEESHKNAYKYFSNSLANYLKTYDKLKDLTDNKKQLVAYLIGTSYEYGKGTKKDLYAAKFWYQKAINKNSHSQAHIALKRVTESIQKIEQKNNYNNNDN